MNHGKELFPDSREKAVRTAQETEGPTRQLGTPLLPKYSWELKGLVYAQHTLHKIRNMKKRRKKIPVPEL